MYFPKRDPSENWRKKSVKKFYNVKNGTYVYRIYDKIKDWKMTITSIYNNQKHLASNISLELFDNTNKIVIINKLRNRKDTPTGIVDVSYW